MNVFILCTGRCGSTTFIEACRGIENYTSGHETKAQCLGEERFSYSSNHIEADNRLSWFLGGLGKRFGDDAFYVHLIRDRDATAQSFNQRWQLSGSIIQHYRTGLLMRTNREDTTNRMAYCYDYYDKVNENITQFLANKPNTLRIEMENWEETFPLFWEAIGARGDLERALLTLVKVHNASKELGTKPVRNKGFGARIIRRLVRIMTLPKK